VGSAVVTVVGAKVGTGVPSTVGASVGLTVGLSVGSKVGELVGLLVGEKVGLSVGLAVGGAVGEGTPVGFFVFLGFMVLGFLVFFGFMVFGFMVFGFMVFLGFMVFFGFMVFLSFRLAVAKALPLRPDSPAAVRVAERAASNRVKRKDFMVSVQCECSSLILVESVLGSDEGQIVRTWCISSEKKPCRVSAIVFHARAIVLSCKL